jgi:hypothetical protein
MPKARPCIFKTDDPPYARRAAADGDVAIIVTDQCIYALGPDISDRLKQVSAFKCAADKKLPGVTVCATYMSPKEAIRLLGSLFDFSVVDDPRPRKTIPKDDDRLEPIGIGMLVG